MRRGFVVAASVVGLLALGYVAYLVGGVLPSFRESSEGITTVVVVKTPSPDIDPPRIAKWSSVGGAEMDSMVEEVRDVYGKPKESQTLKLPVGTRYASNAVTRESYRVRGGTLAVTYVDGVARSFQTDSSRYRTADGIGVGATISRGRCQRNPYGSCEYRWRSFQFDECGQAWVDGSDSTAVVIQMDRNLHQHQQGTDRLVGVRRSASRPLLLLDPHDPAEIVLGIELERAYDSERRANRSPHTLISGIGAGDLKARKPQEPPPYRLRVTGRSRDSRVPSETVWVSTPSGQLHCSSRSGSSKAHRLLADVTRGSSRRSVSAPWFGARADGRT